MDDEIEPVLVRVRTDATAFRREMGALRDEMTGTLGEGADRAGRGIAGALTRAARSGRFEFEDLAKVAARAMGEIAAAALRLDGGGGGAATGLGPLLQSAATALLGAPGRATGGPVGPGRAYMVGERGPELFVPTSSGRVEPIGRGGGSPVQVTVNVNVAAGTQPEFMARTGRQVARDVARVLERVRNTA